MKTSKSRLSLIKLGSNLSTLTSSAVILSPEEFARLSEIEEDYVLLIEANQRLTENGDKPTLSFDTVMSNLGISEQDLNDVEDVVIE